MSKWGSKKWAALALALTIAVAAGCSAADKKESSSMEAPAVGTAEKGEMQFTSSNQAMADSNKQVQVTTDKDQFGKATTEKSNAVQGTSASPPGFAGTTADTNGLNRKLIYTANLVMKVKSYGEAQSQIRDLVALSGGYILQFSENSTTKEEGGQFVLKIPSSGFSSFLKDMEKIPLLSPMQQTVKGTDVSEEYVDLEARLKAKQVQEARYLEFMQKATKTDELVNFTNELGKIQESIEQIKGRMRYIDSNVAYSTVEIRVYQPGGSAAANVIEREDEGVLTRAKHAMQKSLDVLSEFGQGIVVVLAALLPVLVIAAIIGVPAWLVYRLRKKKGLIVAKEHDERTKVFRQPLVGRPADPKASQASEEKSNQGDS